MHRRKLIGVMGSGVMTAGAGCMASSLGNENESKDSSPSNDETRQVAIKDQDTVPHKVGGELRADVIRQNINKDNTAQIEVTFKNAGPKREFEFGSMPPFTVTHSKENDPGVLLIPLEREEPREDPDYEPVSPGCWRPPKSSNPGQIDQTAQFVTLDRGETISHTANVWGDESNHEQDVCLPSGGFRFEKEYSIGPESVPEFTWGFTLSING